MRIRINKQTGVVRYIAPGHVLSLPGQTTISRASNIEYSQTLSPQAQQWLESNGYPRTARKPGMVWADLLPSEGPVLGPFADRQSALRAEHNWLEKNWLQVVQ